MIYQTVSLYLLHNLPTELQSHLHGIRYPVALSLESIPSFLHVNAIPGAGEILRS